MLRFVLMSGFFLAAFNFHLKCIDYATIQPASAPLNCLFFVSGLLSIAAGIYLVNFVLDEVASSGRKVERCVRIIGNGKIVSSISTMFGRSNRPRLET